MPEIKFCPMCGSALVIKEFEGRRHPACPDGTCGYVFWDNPIPVVAAIVERGGEIVLARNKAWPENMFGLITGFLEKNETPGDAILREVKEELGLEGEIVSLVGVYGFFERNQLLVAYHVRAAGEIVAGEELAEIKSVPPERLKPWAYGTGYAVKDWLERRKA